MSYISRTYPTSKRKHHFFFFFSLRKSFHALRPLRCWIELHIHTKEETVETKFYCQPYTLKMINIFVTLLYMQFSAFSCFYQVLLRGLLEPYNPVLPSALVRSSLTKLVPPTSFFMWGTPGNPAGLKTRSDKMRMNLLVGSTAS